MNKLLKLISPMLISTLVSTALIGCEGDKTNQTTTSSSNFKKTQLNGSETFVDNIQINDENYIGNRAFALIYKEDENPTDGSKVTSFWVTRSGIKPGNTDKVELPIQHSWNLPIDSMLSVSVYNYDTNNYKDFYTVIAAYKTTNKLPGAIEIEIPVGMNDKTHDTFYISTSDNFKESDIKSIVFANSVDSDYFKTATMAHVKLMMTTKDGRVYINDDSHWFKEIKVNTSLTESSLSALTSQTSEYNCVDLAINNGVLSARCDVGYISHNRYNSQQLEYTYHVGKQTTPISLDLSKCKPVNKELKDNSYNKDYDVKLVFGYSDSKQTAEWNEANNSKLVCQ